MKINIGAAVLALAVLAACQNGAGNAMSGSGDAADNGPGTHTAGGDRIGPSYMLKDDPRVTAAFIELSNATKARCTAVAAADATAYQSCIIDHLAGALPFGAEMAPHCASESDFPERFYCVMVGSAAADIVDKSKIADPHEFLKAHGDEQRESAATAVQMLAKSISDKCPLEWTHTGCAAKEMAARLDRSEADIKECTLFSNDWKDATCVVIGRMADVFSRSATQMQ